MTNGRMPAIIDKAGGTRCPPHQNGRFSRETGLGEWGEKPRERVTVKLRREISQNAQTVRSAPAHTGSRTDHGDFAPFCVCAACCAGRRGRFFAVVRKLIPRRTGS